MALKPCKECGKEISTEAKVCPNCGKTNPTAADTGGRRVLIAIGVGLVLIMFAKFASNDSGRTPTLPNAGVATTPPPPTREQRLNRVLAVTREGRTVEGDKCTRATSARIGRLLDQHPEWQEDVIGTIACGWIVQGMTPEQLIASWGKPESVNRSVGASGVHEQWVYSNHSSYAYFDDGVLTSWQSSR